MKSFTCDRCKKTFKCSSSDTAAKEELKKNFPEYADAPRSKQSVVCDNCYRDFMEWYQRQPPSQH